MRTSAVYPWGGHGVRRARIPGVDEIPAERDSWANLSFRPAEEREVEQITSLDPFRTRKVTRRYPERISAGSSAVYEFHRGRCDSVRVIPELYVGTLDAIDTRIAELIRERAELLDEAFRRGRPITLTEAREWAGRKA